MCCKLDLTLDFIWRLYIVKKIVFAFANRRMWRISSSDPPEWVCERGLRKRKVCKNHLFWLVIVLWCCWFNTWVINTACSWLNYGFTTLQHKDHWGKQYLHLQALPLRAGTSGFRICLAGLWGLQRKRNLATWSMNTLRHLVEKGIEEGWRQHHN